MDEQEFAQLKAKAISQTNVNNKQHSDAETMGLQIAWLNFRYRGRGVYFALLDEPGLDLQTFPAPEGSLAFIFYKHQHVWTVARVKRFEAKFTMFDGLSAKQPNRLHEDHCRTERLQHLAVAVRRHLSQLGMPETVVAEIHNIVTPVPDSLSAMTCRVGGGKVPPVAYRPLFRRRGRTVLGSLHRPTQRDCRDLRGGGR